MSALVRVVELEPSDCDEKVLGDFKAFVLAGGRGHSGRSGGSYSLRCSAHFPRRVLLLVWCRCTQTPGAQSPETRLVEVGRFTAGSGIPF
jgi:hypothetical protein